MNKHIASILALVLVLVLAGAVSCGPDAPAPAEPTEAPTEEPAAPEPTEEPAPAEEESVTYDTVFPLPEDVQGFTGEGGEAMVNFQTSLSMEEAVAFYRDALTAQGLTERELLTVIEDTTFSLVFDGHENGQALVIQGVGMGEVTNVNIRFEDI
jgi:hypothetical protein